MCRSTCCARRHGSWPQSAVGVWGNRLVFAGKPMPRRAAGHPGDLPALLDGGKLGLADPSDEAVVDASALF